MFGLYIFSLRVWFIEQLSFSFYVLFDALPFIIIIIVIIIFVLRALVITIHSSAFSAFYVEINYFQGVEDI